MPPKYPQEVLRKEFTTCQNLGCGKSRMDEGVTLSRCAGCKIALYCSKACQKAGWPTHKTTCKLNQRSQAAGSSVTPDSRGDMLKRLRAFCNKHRPSLAEYGIRALDLPVDYTRSLREVVLLQVKYLPTATRPELLFRAQDARVVPLAYFGHKEVELRSQLQDISNQQKSIGKLGSIMVIVMETETFASNVCPVAFSQDVLTLDAGQPWKTALLNTLNLGIVY